MREGRVASGRQVAAGAYAEWRNGAGVAGKWRAVVMQRMFVAPGKIPPSMV